MALTIRKVWTTAQEVWEGVRADPANPEHRQANVYIDDPNQPLDGRLQWVQAIQEEPEPLRVIPIAIDTYRIVPTDQFGRTLTPVDYVVLLFARKQRESDGSFTYQLYTVSDREGRPSNDPVHLDFPAPTSESDALDMLFAVEEDGSMYLATGGDGSARVGRVYPRTPAPGRQTLQHSDTFMIPAHPSGAIFPWREFFRKGGYTLLIAEHATDVPKTFTGYVQKTPGGVVSKGSGDLGHFLSNVVVKVVDGKPLLHMVRENDVSTLLVGTPGDAGRNFWLELTAFDEDRAAVQLMPVANNPPTTYVEQPLNSGGFAILADKLRFAVLGTSPDTADHAPPDPDPVDPDTPDPDPVDPGTTPGTGTDVVPTTSIGVGASDLIIHKWKEALLFANPGYEFGEQAFRGIAPHGLWGDRRARGTGPKIVPGNDIYAWWRFGRGSGSPPSAIPSGAVKGWPSLTVPVSPAAGDPAEFADLVLAQDASLNRLSEIDLAGTNEIDNFEDVGVFSDQGVQWEFWRTVKGDAVTQLRFDLEELTFVRSTDPDPVTTLGTVALPGDAEVYADTASDFARVRARVQSVSYAGRADDRGEGGSLSFPATQHTVVVVIMAVENFPEAFAFSPGLHWIVMEIGGVVRAIPLDTGIMARPRRMLVTGQYEVGGRAS